MNDGRLPTCQVSHRDPAAADCFVPVFLAAARRTWNAEKDALPSVAVSAPDLPGADTAHSDDHDPTGQRRPELGLLLERAKGTEPS